MSQRFTDDGQGLSEFILEPIEVECPRCDARAVLIPVADRPSHLHVQRRLICQTCGLVKHHDGSSLRFAADGRDPCFQLPLWYRCEMSKGTLWAYHRRQLEILRQFVAATDRARGRTGTCHNQSYISRLPLWIKSAKNRDMIVETIDRMLMR